MHLKILKIKSINLKVKISDYDYTYNKIVYRYNIKL